MIKANTSISPGSHLPQLLSYGPADFEAYIGGLVEGGFYRPNEELPTRLLREPVQLLEEEVEEVKMKLLGWLPSQLKKLGYLPQDTLSISESAHPAYHNESRLIHATNQVWGVVPSAEEVHRKGPILEVGGPTKYTEEQLSMIGGSPPGIVTNIAQPGALYGYMGAVDAYMDATELSVNTDSLGALVATGLPGGRYMNNNLRDSSIEEASRVVASSGRLFWIGGLVHDFSKIVAEGFSPEYVRASIIFGEDTRSGDVELGGLVFEGSFVKLG